MVDEGSYDFGDARFDLNDPADREILRFILSQALYGEATGVFCGKSLYSAGSLEVRASTCAKRSKSSRTCSSSRTSSARST